MIIIRRFQPGEEPVLHELFFNTIHNVNIKDYSKEQVNAWAPRDYNIDDWTNRIRSLSPFVALIDNNIVGYADIQDDGFINHFYCHWQYQGEGIGKTLMQTLFNEGKRKNINRFYAHVSVTAKSFFEHCGFSVVKNQHVTIRGMVLKNFLMEKIVPVP